MDKTLSKHFFINFGQVSKKARREQQIKAEDLAEAVGVSANHISKVENAKVRPSIDLLVAITRYLKLDANRFIYPEMSENELKKQDLIQVIDLLNEKDLDILLAVAGVLRKND